MVTLCFVNFTSITKERQRHCVPHGWVTTQGTSVAAQTFSFIKTVTPEPVSSTGTQPKGLQDKGESGLPCARQEVRPELILVAKGLTSQVPESAPSEAEHWVGSEEGPPSPPVGGWLFPFAPGSRVSWDAGFLVQKKGQFWANRGSWSSYSSLGRWWEDMEGAGDTPFSTASARAEPGSTAVKRAAGRCGSCRLLASTHLLGEQ